MQILLVEDCKLVDFKGDYEYFLEQNTGEAEKMEAKAEKVRFCSGLTVQLHGVTVAVH